MRFRIACIFSALLLNACSAPSTMDSGTDDARDASIDRATMDAQSASPDADVPAVPTDSGVCPMGTTACVGSGCVDTQSDPRHCGACANQCPMGTTCQGATCTCPASTSLCGGSCVNTQTNTAHCGACGVVCGMGEFCVSGACQASCPMPNLVCGVGAMRVCTNTQSDSTNCGSCGSVCIAANANTSCTNGLCGIGSCTAGFANCDELAVNGCEVNTRSNLAHCGACGAVCTIANGTASCAAGMCSVGACNAGFANCDMNSANGCETNTSDNALHCGACGNACGAGRSCRMGACVCDAGTSLCGGSCVNTQTDTGNCGACGTACPMGQLCVAGACQLGCPMPNRICGMGAMMTCVNTQSDLSNCGGCGVGCSVANASASCASGACGIAACNAGFGNCDMNSANGCEVNQLTNTQHCGGCGVVCAPRANASVSCSSGMCGLNACNAGFGNCDLNPANGCETNTNISIVHCGACGSLCNLANSLSACTAGTCGITSCRAGFGNCDNNVANGCETSTTTVTNCGACGTVCPGDPNGSPVCSMGACTLSCVAGYSLVGGRCVTFPRPIAPLSLGDVSLLRPTLRWILPAGFDGALVELCRDRACSMLIDVIRAPGSAVRPPVALPARRAIYWRLRGYVGAMTSMTYSPTWMFHTPSTDATSGADTSYRAHTDFNGDGFDDIVAGAGSASPGGRLRAGTASVYHGSMTGIALVATRVLEGVLAEDNFGSTVANAGDLNGDGFGDLVVNAPQSDPGGRVGAGTVSVFFGSAAGVAAMPTRVLEGAVAGEQFGGRAIAAAGDLNRDGYSDLVVGAGSADRGGRSNVGTFSVFYGTSTGVALAPSITVEGVVADEQLGASVASAGDVNGDGYSDLAIGAPAASPGGRVRFGAVSIYHGAVAGITNVAARTLEGSASGCRFGFAVAGAGDVNNDGFTDVIVGAPDVAAGGMQGVGSANIFHGSMMGVSAVAARVLTGGAAFDGFGSAVDSAGDVNADGFGDVVVGSPLGDLPGRTNCGFVFVFSGSASGVGIPGRSAVGFAASDVLGESVAGAGDVNGDGFADIVAGASGASPGGRMFAGLALVYHGANTGLPGLPSRIVEGVVGGDFFGRSVAKVEKPEQRLICIFADNQRPLSPSA